VLHTLEQKFLKKIDSLSDWKYLLFIEGIYLLVCFSLFSSWPQPWPDEVEFADAGRTLAEKGYLGTALIKGMETHVYWQPPLYFILLALVIKVAGFSLVALRILSIAVGCMVIIATYTLGLKVTENSTAPRLGVLFLVLNPNFVNYIKLARMDGVCVLLTVLALVLYFELIDCPSQKKYLLVGGLLGLAVLFHPLGFIGILAILVHQFYKGIIAREKIGKVGMVLLPVFIALGLWGLYILDDPHNFILQMNYQFLRKVLSPQLSFVHFLERYRTTPFFLFSLLLSMVYLLWLKPKEKPKRSSLLTILLVTSFIIVGFSFALPYHLYLLPYGSLAIAVLLVDGWRSSVRTFSFLSRFGVAVLLVNFLLYFGYLNFVFHYQLSKETNYERFVSTVESYIPSHSTVYLYGYPSLFWGLRKSPKELSFIEDIWLSEEMSAKIVRQTDYVIMSRGFNPPEDEPELGGHLRFLQEQCSQNSRAMHIIANVGVRRRFAYSAEIYCIGPSSTP
jgi:hypothetical protein